MDSLEAKLNKSSQKTPQQILLEEVAKIDRREGAKVKLKYSKNDTDDIYAIDSDKYHNKTRVV